MLTKKILLTNRHIIKFSMPYMYPIGVCVCVIMGLGIIMGFTPKLVIEGWSLWTGFFIFYGGVLLLLGYVVDLIYGVLSPAKRIHRRRNSLKERIRRQELDAD